MTAIDMTLSQCCVLEWSTLLMCCTQPARIMQARSHKQEIILVHFRGRELGMALNMVLNLHRLSFEHFLLLALDESSCQLALKAFPEAGGRAAHGALILQTANVAQYIVRLLTSA